MTNCPCGSTKDYSDCCEPFHKGSSFATTAEQLMRTRYSAFVKNEIDYIMDTFHSTTREEVDRNEIQQWAMGSTWNGLEIVKTENGQAQDETGIVEFKASYDASGKKVIHHERSSFEKKDNKWYFVDGEIIQDSFVRQGPKVGRNDPCPCGSGKKYKKCCL